MLWGLQWLNWSCLLRIVVRSVAGEQAATVVGYPHRPSGWDAGTLLCDTESDSV